jgi:glutamine synthetase
VKFDTPEQLDAYLEQAGIRFYKVAVVDIDGVMRGKYVNATKFRSAVRKGFGMCDVVLGWDSADQLYDNTDLVGLHTGYQDAWVRLDLATVRRLPLEDDTILVLGQFEGVHSGACPRSLLGRVIERAAAAGFSAAAAFEYEFFVFDETPESVREKGYRNLKPFTPGMFGYSMLRSGVHADLYHQLLTAMEELEADIEGLHTETGPGVVEAALCHRPALDAADRAALFKTYTKVLLQRAGLMGTFMAKWNSDYPGQSGHLHISLSNQAGENVFFENGGDGLSKAFRHFAAGQALLLPDVLAMVCSTVNAYRRLVPGTWAPTHATWGIENRTTAIRAIPAGPTGTRSEYRIGPADGNPYLVLAAALATGLYGMEHGLELPSVSGNAYEHPGDGAPALSTSLGEATQRFLESKVTRQLFGDAFVTHFSQTRIWEDRAARRYVSDFDLARYFEII